MRYAQGGKAFLRLKHALAAVVAREYRAFPEPFRCNLGLFARLLAFERKDGPSLDISLLMVATLEAWPRF